MPKKDQPGLGLDTLERTKTQRPRLWNVVMLNDDFTPMDFVVMVLKRIFKKTHEEAEAITFQVHVEGKGIAGTYTYEVAETKAQETISLALREQHPLKLDIQPVD